MKAPQFVGGAFFMMSIGVTLEKTSFYESHFKRHSEGMCRNCNRSSRFYRIQFQHRTCQCRTAFTTGVHTIRNRQNRQIPDEHVCCLAGRQDDVGGNCLGYGNRSITNVLRQHKHVVRPVVQYFKNKSRRQLITLKTNLFWAARLRSASRS